MKSSLLLCMVVLMYACTSSAVKNDKSGTDSADSLRDMGGGYTDSQYAKGAQLIVANDCSTCHKLNDTSVGPSYMDISKKYHSNEGNIDNLVNEIIKGSNGFVWGKNKMTPHPNLQTTDAEEIVKFIFSLTNDNP